MNAVAEVEMSFASEMFGIARKYAEQHSDDPKRKVGVLLQGYSRGLVECNRLTPGVKVAESKVTAPLKYFYIEHAERNAIAKGQGLWGTVAGMEMYLPWFPCADCARAMVLARIGELHCVEPDFTDDRWGESHRAALEIMRAGGVEVFYVEGEKPPS